VESNWIDNQLPPTAVSPNGWFYLSQPEITQPENCLYLQLTIKLPPLREAAEH